MLYRYDGQRLELDPPKNFDGKKWWVIRDHKTPFGLRLGYGDRYEEMPFDIIHNIRNPGHVATYSGPGFAATYFAVDDTSFSIRSLDYRLKEWVIGAMRRLKPNITDDEIQQALNQINNSHKGGFSVNVFGQR
jgi:hypothetical protein